MANPEHKKKSIDKAKTVPLSKREFKGDGNNAIEKKGRMTRMVHKFSGQ